MPQEPPPLYAADHLLPAVLRLLARQLGAALHHHLLLLHVKDRVPPQLLLLAGPLRPAEQAQLGGGLPADGDDLPVLAPVRDATA